jgi:hypothetical protein
LEREFLALTEAQGVSDIDELNKILDWAVTLKTFLKAAERVDRVARFVAEHYRTNVEPLGYKAFLVGVDREACALYKQALNRYLTAEYSVVVYTAAHNDDELLQQYYVRWQFPFDAAHRLSAPSSGRRREETASRKSGPKRTSTCACPIMASCSRACSRRLSRVRAIHNLKNCLLTHCRI